MIDLPSLVRMVGGIATVFYGVVVVVAIGFLVLDSPSKLPRAAESEGRSRRRAA